MSLSLAVSTKISTRPAPRGVVLLEVAEVAERTGMSERWVRTQCETCWQFNGMAEFKMPAEGGKKRWFISPDADPRLSRHPRGDEIRPDAEVIQKLTSAQRAKWAKKLEILDRWKVAFHASRRVWVPIDQRVREYVNSVKSECVTVGIKISVKTLRKWENAHHFNGPEALIDGRGTAKRENNRDDRMLQEAARFYLDASAPTAAECLRAAEQRAVQEGWRVWKASAVYKHLKKLPPGEVTFRRYGRDKFNDLHEPTLQRDPVPTAALLRRVARARREAADAADAFRMQLVAAVGRSERARRIAAGEGEK